MLDKRILIKSLTWRVIVLVVTYLTALLTGIKNKQAIVLTVVLNLINIVLYYAHEKIWLRYKGLIK